jgi:hypothetical protein
MFIKYHVFGSTLCLGTLVLRDPSSDMATFVLTQIDAAITLFTSLLEHGAKTPRYQRNLQWLCKLRSRVSARISVASQARQMSSQLNADAEAQVSDKEDGEDAELLGWRTRLVERAGQNHQTSRTVHHAPTLSRAENLSTSSPNTSNSMHPMTSCSLQTPDSMNDIVSSSAKLFDSQSSRARSYTIFGIQCSYMIFSRFLKIKLM